jgi:hypothetical protein
MSRCECCGADGAADQAEWERVLLKHAREQNVLLTALETATKEIALRDIERESAQATITALRIEIERLKKWNLMTDEQVVLDLKQQIRLLRAELETLKAMR